MSTFTSNEKLKMLFQTDKRLEDRINYLEKRIEILEKLLSVKVDNRIIPDEY